MHPFRSTMSRFRDTGAFTLDVRYHGNGRGNWDELTKTCYMVLNIPQRAQISSVSLYDEPFPRYRSVYFRRPLPWQRSRKFGRVDKNMLNGSKHNPQGPHVHLFRSTVIPFRDTGPFTLDVRYHGNGHGNWDELTKTCYMVVNIPHRTQIIIRFALR